MQKTVNIHETDGGSVTVVVPKDFSRDHRRQLIALRVKHGADTPIGHRCSNLIELLKHYETAVGDRRIGLRNKIARTVREIERLSEPSTKRCA